jgi:hypothetical protein
MQCSGTCLPFRCSPGSSKVQGAHPPGGRERARQKVILGSKNAKVVRLGLRAQGRRSVVAQAVASALNSITKE